MRPICILAVTLLGKPNAKCLHVMFTMRFIQGLRVFFVGNGFFCDGGLVGGFFATVGVGGFLRQCRVFFCDSGKVFGYGKEGYLHQWGFSATVTGVYYIGTGPEHQEG